jgi:broad specificity phosphatase PhoE
MLDALMEMDVGKTEGMKLLDVRDLFPIFFKEWSGPNKIHVAMPGGESLIDIEVRVESILDDFKSFKEGNIAIVAHNFVLRILICKLLGLSVSAFNSFVLDLASITIVEMIPYPHVLRMNETCHIG